MTRHSWPAASLAIALLGTGAAAHAEPFAFTLTGTLYEAALSGTSIADGTAFTATALFDTSSPNLVPYIPGTAIYVPTQTSITFGGTTYQIAPFSAATPYGIGVAIFDPTSPFPPSPEYAVGLIGNPVLDGAGIVADFNASSPNFTVDQLVTTTFPTSNFVGAGNFSGICTDDPSICNNPNLERNSDIEPFPLTANGQSYSLTFGNNVILDYDQALDDPSSGSSLPFDTVISVPFTASLTDVPEPSSWLLLGVGVLMLTATHRFRRG